MGRRLALMAMVAMMTIAPGAFAADVSIEGTYVVDGDYYDTGDADYGYYSHELDIAVMFKADENTYLKTSFGIVDRTWGDYETVPGDKDMYANEFTLDRVWLTHVFERGYKAEAGLMDGGVWGTMLGDADDGYLRLRVSKEYSFGTLCAYVQKNSEVGEHDTAAKDGEKDDADEFSVGMTLKAGDITIMPMVAYTDDSSTVEDQGNDGTKTFLGNLAISGDLGAIGFEAEINYYDVSTDVAGDSDFSNVNIYADVWTTLDAIRAGLAFAYGTEDDGNYVDFGTDFCPMVLMDNDGDIYGLGAMMLGKVYGEYTINEKFSAGCALSYGETADDYKDGVADDNVMAGDDTILEFDVTGSYKITDALTYSVSVAYADVDSLDDSIFYLGNEIEFAF